jgi:pimeloyl-ACP methyl ester carboxylesterase
MTTASVEPSRSGYADVNGLHMYYEEYGVGSPLILLHGGMLTIDLNFAGLIPALSQRHRVIGVEMQGCTAAPPTSTARSPRRLWRVTSSDCSTC